MMKGFIRAMKASREKWSMSKSILSSIKMITFKDIPVRKPQFKG